MADILVALTVGLCYDISDNKDLQDKHSASIIKKWSELFFLGGVENMQ